MPQVATARRVMHKKFEIIHAYGRDALTVDQAKERLGWVEEPEGERWGEDYWIRDLLGKKIRATNNFDPRRGVYNRPIDIGWSTQLAQDLLNRNWAGPTTMPGETVNASGIICIGRTGRIISAQHSLVALVFANQIWKGIQGKDQSHHWQEKWPSATYPLGPVMDCLIAVGVSEDERVMRTVDCVRPRTIADTLYVDGYFAKAAPRDREVLCKMMEYATKTLWDRTGVDDNAFSPNRTISQVVDYLDRHPKIKKMVQHIFEQNQSNPKRNALSQYLGLGTAAGLAYLMAASGTDPDAYETKFEAPTERKINFDQWDKAQEFWMLLATGDAQVRAVPLARRPLADGEYNGHYFARTSEAGEDVSGGSLSERLGTIIKGWNVWKDLNKGKLTAEDVKLTYVASEEGDLVLQDFPTVGGIDTGGRASKAQRGADEGVSEQEAADRVAQARAERTNGAAPVSDKKK